MPICQNKSIFAIFQKCKFTHPHTYMLLTVTSGILYISIPHLHRQMLNVNEKQTEKPVENRVKGTGVERKCSLTYSITEYYLTWDTVVISLHILDHEEWTTWERAMAKYLEKSEKLKSILGLYWPRNSRKGAYLHVEFAVWESWKSNWNCIYREHLAINASHNTCTLSLVPFSCYLGS